MVKKIDEIIAKLEEIPKEDIAKEYELNGAAHAFLLLPECLVTDLSYEVELMRIKAKYDCLKKQILMKAANEICKLNEECEAKLEHIRHIKEVDDRVEAKLKSLGL